MLNTLVLTAAEAAEHHEKVNHWIIGIITLVLLWGLMAMLLAFAGGREHS